MKQANSVKVWDPLVRIFHWSLVTAFLFAYGSGEDFLALHTWAGYLILGLLSVRTIWGFIGTRHARFTDFVRRPAMVRQFLTDTLQFKARRYVGHNPAGGAMVVALMLSLLVTGFTGMLVLGAEDQAGPLATWFSSYRDGWGELMEEVHEFFANFTVLLVLLHIVGVIAESLINKENLVSAMITGYKPDRSRH